MIDAIASTRALPWPGSVPRRRTRLLAPGTPARAAARHGLRGALQTLVLSAALMAAAGTVGASRGPVELNEPAHAASGTAAVLLAPSAPTGAGVAGKVTSR
ncbi:MAG TPA: hypothetical protein VFC09_02620 [Candidatus Dormibacteraeota bacterium]|nr:hypothetical protein [Candidatus Dormibacteraeota bacterium]